MSFDTASVTAFFVVVRDFLNAARALYRRTEDYLTTWIGSEEREGEI
jgi:hypothetical protein